MVEVKAMLCERLDIERADPYLDSDDWWVEQKIDGHRTLIHVAPQGVVGYNRDGTRRAVPPSVVSALSEREPGVILDGELLGDTYHVFDLLALGAPTTTFSYHVRRVGLEIFLPESSGPLRLMYVARTPIEKRTLLGQVREINGEGVVLKKTSAPYRVGVRSHNWLKAKFEKSCECGVMEIGPEGKDSLAVGLHDGRKLTEVTKVKVSPEVLAAAQVGDVVEVRYLHFTKDRRLREPVYLRHRPDKSLADCGFDQVTTASKEVLESLDPRPKSVGQ